MKWYNFETSFTSLKNAVRAWLKENGVKYELSDATHEKGYLCYHFEVYTDADGAKMFNDFIDSTWTEFQEQR